MNPTSVISYLSTACCFGLALTALARAGRALERWAFAVGMLALAAESLLAGLGGGADSTAGMIRWQQSRLLASSFLPGIWLFFSLHYARGARRRPSFSRWLLWGGAVLLPAAFAAVYWNDLFVSTPLSGVEDYRIFRMGWPAQALHAFLLVGSVAVLVNLERTFRASVGTMRWRIKYMILGVGLIFLARLYTSSQVVLFRDVSLSMENINPAAILLGGLLILRSLFRTGHFDTDVYPSQTVLQGSLTILLAGAYLVIVGILAKVVIYLGDNSSFELKALLILVLLVLFALVLQSDRVRLHVRRLVSRHFRRPVYDYRTVWRTFTEGTATRMEQADLCRALVRLVADLFQALSVTIWTVDEGRGLVTLAASTSLDAGASRAGAASRVRSEEVIRRFHDHPEPVNFEAVDRPWAEALRTWHPTEFPEKGGDRVCVPITSAGEVLGLITMGDRVGGISFSLQDFDMLKCIAEHAAAGLVNTHLSQKLLQAKELESFQAMAAFFVHDLKNAASTLNLMLRNLPVHFDDPAFREDALRGIAKTVTRINELTGRLNSLREELKVNRREADLNELIGKALTTVQLGPGVAVERDLADLPPMKFDEELIGKVLLNLLLNASEAMEGNGRLRVASGQANGNAVVTVVDSGCGMSADFVNRSLFRPFQTTKKHGLGIGMFQCKAIIEAHGGNITVASEPGKGTTFKIFLPLASRAE